MTFRLPATEARYQADIKAGRTKPLTDEPALRQWRYWKLIDNAYPHDKLYSVHHLLVPKSGFVNLMEATSIEIDEYLDIIFNQLVNNGYDVTKNHYPKQQSIKNIFHTHLAVIIKEQL